MEKFIDIEDQSLTNRPRNLINSKYIIRIERLTPGDEGSPVNIYLSDGTTIYSKIAYRKFVALLEGDKL